MSLYLPPINMKLQEYLDVIGQLNQGHLSTLLNTYIILLSIWLWITYIGGIEMGFLQRRLKR